MNIERYKWPVIVAAGLHGALFLSIPDSSRGYTRNAADKPAVLRMIPLDPAFPVPPNEDDLSADDRPIAGSRGIATLPDDIAPLNDNANFVMPIVDHVRVENPKSTLKGYVGGPEGPSIGSIFSNPGAAVDFSKLDKNPRATAQISPDYPAAMRQEGITGSVTVKFEVNKDGRVIRVEAIDFTRREFVEPALRAVRTWPFEPGKQNGRAVAFRMTVPIEFSLDQD